MNGAKGAGRSGDMRSISRGKLAGGKSFIHQYRRIAESRVVLIVEQCGGEEEADGIAP